jgi:cytochrome b subunit of formate dehydrogenase
MTMTLERYRRRSRLIHAGVYVLTLLLLFTGLWLLAGREGQPSPLAFALGGADSTVHTVLGWALAALALLGLLLGGRGVALFVRETLRYDRGDLRWLVRWPQAVFSGRFARHEGHFDPGQRVANVLIVAGLGVLLGSGVGLAVVHGGPAFVWFHRVHTWATYVLLPVLAGHVLIALGLLPGYRGVWRAMHLGGRVSVETARRVWPGWTERVLGEREGGSLRRPAQCLRPRAGQGGMTAQADRCLDSDVAPQEPGGRGGD